MSTRATLFLFAILLTAPGCSRSGPATTETKTGEAKTGEEPPVAEPPAASDTAPTSGETPPAVGTREERALAFFNALKSGEAENVLPFLLTPDDCKFMEEAMKKDNADPARCREGITRFLAGIDTWLPPLAQRAGELTPTGAVTFEAIPEPGAPAFALMVTIQTKEAKDFPLAAFLLDGHYRFGIPMKRAAP